MNLNRLFSIFKPKNPFEGVLAVVLGIGNIGLRYEGTRHNIGFLVADRLSNSLKSPKRFAACKSDVITGELDGKKIAIIKPQTFVNRSGEAAGMALAKAGLVAGALWVAVDDLNLPLGTLRLRGSGSDGGHNGLKSIIASCGRGFPRLRIGIGPVPKETSVIDFVLGPFDNADLDRVEEAVVRGVESLRCGLTGGIESAMSKFNN